MFSANDRSTGRGPDLDLWRKKARKLLASKTGGEFRPRLSMRIWLTALFVLVTAFAAITAYEIVHPILSETLNRSSEAAFKQVGDQFEDQVQRLRERGEPVTEQRINAFARSHGLEWGIVRYEDGQQTRGELDDWSPRPVRRAVEEPRRPSDDMEQVETGVHKGQLQATYAYPINVDVKDKAEPQPRAIVFVKYFTENDVENVQAALSNIERLALLAGALALLIAGFAGYFAAVLISRRVSRLGLAAEHLAAGNFDARIQTRVEDEVGSLGATFNAMAVSLKEAFDQIGQEKERGKAILDGMTDAVVGVDRDLNPVFLNPRARKLLESSDHAFHNRLQEVLAKTRYSGPVTESEAKAGERVIEIRAAPLEDGALAILRDVTEERHMQRVKAEFIANASHELKTPLTALSGYLEMLEDEEDERVRAEFLNDMRVQTTRLQSLARTLLDLSRLDANAVTFRTEEVDVEDLLHGLRRDFGYTGRSLNIRAEENVPLVRTDPNQLHRAIAILVDNALKYSDEGSPVDLGLSREDGQIIISVTDRGCGIPESEIPYIFDRFYRAQGSSRADGTGLGLALAHEITDHLGGEIHVHSRPDAGSIFSVLLPLAADSPGTNGSRSL
ncbi:MAG: cell wall metabolism sensor histidine kinase WalK [Actinomycetota bacterium]|nr:HAMP domain-containing protein [Rubrobacteraceae bacterium]MDQ3496129.1 cell wall metabolism sensor histidine kinase WalK [Actinomycetota bacterium]